MMPVYKRLLFFWILMLPLWTAGAEPGAGKTKGIVDFKRPAARFAGENKTENAHITVYQNGQLIHDDYALKRQTGAGKKEGPEARPIKLQGHHNPVRFRNVWIQTLSLD